MAHMVETMAYAGEVPWHGLGKKVPADLTPDQMLEAAGLDWEVEARDMHVTASDGETQLLVPNKKGLYRTSDDSFFDVIGEDWKPLQNHEAFSFFDGFIAEGDMKCIPQVRLIQVAMFGRSQRLTMPLKCSRMTSLSSICCSLTPTNTVFLLMSV